MLSEREKAKKLKEREKAKKLKEREKAKKLKEREKAKKLKEREKAKKLKEREKAKKLKAKIDGGGNFVHCSKILYYAFTNNHYAHLAEFIKYLESLEFPNKMNMVFYGYKPLSYFVLNNDTRLEIDTDDKDKLNKLIVNAFCEFMMNRKEHETQVGNENIIKTIPPEMFDMIQFILDKNPKTDDTTSYLKIFTELYEELEIKINTELHTVKRVSLHFKNSQIEKPTIQFQSVRRSSSTRVAPVAYPKFDGIVPSGNL